MIRRTIVALAATATAAAMLATPVQAAERRDVGVTVSGRYAGPEIVGWGVDLKQRGRARYLADRPDVTRSIFRSPHIKYARVSFRADERGVDEDGNLRTGYLDSTLDVLRVARQVNPGLKVIGSRVTINDCPVKLDRRYPGANLTCFDYAPSLKGGDPHGTLSVYRYGRVAAQYVAYLRSQRLGPSIFELDNEPHNNEGNLTPRRFADVVRSLDRNLGDAPMPRLTPPSENNPDGDWLRAAPQSLTRQLTFATAHTNPDRRNRQKPGLVDLAQAGRARGLMPINTEFHWTETSNRYAETRNAFLSMFDNLDAGIRMISWWGYKARGTSTLKARMQEAMLSSTTGARWVHVTDVDGPSSAAGTFVTRAYRKGDMIRLWVVNDRRRPVSQSLAIRANADLQVGTVRQYFRWTSTRGRLSGFQQGTPARAGMRMTLAPVRSFPAKSVTLVYVKVRR